MIIPESLRLYVFCKALKFTHLPVAGGIYDQHPKLIRDWLTIMSIEAQEEKKRQEKQERDMKAKKGSQGRRR